MKNSQMKIRIQLNTGEYIPLTITPTSTILDIKQAVKKQKGIDLPSQTIHYKNKIYQDQAVLKVIGVQQNDILVSKFQNNPNAIKSLNNNNINNKQQNNPIAKLSKQNLNKLLLSYAVNNTQNLQSKLTPARLIQVQNIIRFLCDDFELVSKAVLSIQNKDIFNKVWTEARQNQSKNPQFNQRQLQAIQRLVSLGFDKLDATEAYMVCGGNQQMAANLLFDQYPSKQ